MQTFRDWKDGLTNPFQAPALVVSGDQDVVRPEHAVEMYRLFPHGRLAIFPSNHGSYMGEIMSPATDSKVLGPLVAMLEEFLSEPMPEKK